MVREKQGGIGLLSPERPTYHNTGAGDEVIGGPPWSGGFVARRKQKQQTQRHIEPASDLRIVGGQYRGSRLEYHGDRTTRPMKHRVREAIFNLLGTDVAGKHAIDLFAGTGAIGLEALSRGAASATFIERHVPTARIIESNIRRLGVADRCELLCTSAFLWARRHFEQQPSRDADDFRLPLSADRPFQWESVAPDVAWAVFCSPPYDFYMDRRTEMLALIETFVRAAPAGSVLVVESDERFDFNDLATPGAGNPEAGRRAESGAWRVRSYPPAQIGILRLDEPE